MSTFANLEKVTIENTWLSFVCKDGRPIDNLSERFQFPCVGELHFVAMDEIQCHVWNLNVTLNELDSRHDDPFGQLLDVRALLT